MQVDLEVQAAGVVAVITRLQTVALAETILGHNYQRLRVVAPAPPQTRLRESLGKRPYSRQHLVYSACSRGFAERTVALAVVVRPRPVLVVADA
jgi:hypothetical protein